MRRGALVFVVVAVSALAASSCTGGGGEPDDRAAPDLAFVTPDDLDRQRAVWGSEGPASYSYRIEATCTCDRGGEYLVTVVDGEVVDVEPAGGGEPHRDYFGQTVEGMFDMFEETEMVRAEESARGAAAFAEFDEVTGHPVRFAVRWGLGAPGYSATITDLAPIEPGAAPPDEAPQVSLVISNQSFADPDVRIVVESGGEALVDGLFLVEGQHTFVSYSLPLAPGEHVLRIRSDSGAFSELTVEVEPDRQLYVYVGYWSGEGPPTFSVEQSAEPFVFN